LLILVSAAWLVSIGCQPLLFSLHDPPSARPTGNIYERWDNANLAALEFKRPSEQTLLFTACRLASQKKNPNL
jgi:hypothetical protein